MYALRSRTPHAHELSQSRLNDHDGQSTIHGDPTSPGSINTRAKSGGTRIQARHSLLSQQLVALWNRQGLTLQERQRQIGSSRVLTHATEDHVACLQSLINSTDFSCQPRGGAKRPLSATRGREDLMSEVFRPIRQMDPSSLAMTSGSYGNIGSNSSSAAAPTAGGGGAVAKSPYKSVTQRGGTPVNAMALTPIQALDSPDRYQHAGNGSRPVSRHLNYTANNSVGYNDSASLSGFTTPGATPSKEHQTQQQRLQELQDENTLRQQQQQQKSTPGTTEERKNSTEAVAPATTAAVIATPAPTPVVVESEVLPQPEAGKPRPNHKAAWRQYEEGSEGALQTVENKQAKQLVDTEGIHRTMVRDEALSQMDIMYLTHCHAQMSIESQLLDRNKQGHADGESYSPMRDGGAIHAPSFIYERTSDSVLLQGLPNEKIDRLFLLEKSHRIKLERVGLLGPSTMWDLFIVGRTETTQRNIIRTQYDMWAAEMYDNFSGFLNRYLYAKPLLRLVFTAFYRVEQEENAAWMFLSESHDRKKKIIAKCQPVFSCQKEDRCLHIAMEEVEREELLALYEEHFSVAVHLQTAREDCELETINQDEDYVRCYEEADEVYSRQLIQLQGVEGTVRHKMAELHSDKHSVLVKAESVLTVVEDAKTQLRHLAEQTSVATMSQDQRVNLEANAGFELRETSDRMVDMVEEATERCLIYVELREARDRLQLQGKQQLEVIQLESENYHRTVTHDEDALFHHIPQAVFLQCATDIEREWYEIQEALFHEEQRAWYQIPVDLCVEELQHLEDHESVEREKIDVVEVDDREEVAVNETGGNFVVGLGVEVLQDQLTVYAAAVIQRFAHRVVNRARRNQRRKEHAVEAFLQEIGSAANIVQRCVRVFKARLARRKQLQAQAAAHHQDAEDQEQQYASAVMGSTSRKFVERRDAKKIVNQRRSDKEATEKLLVVGSVADAVHNEAQHRHDVMMAQIGSYMELSQTWLAVRAHQHRSNLGDDEQERNREKKLAMHPEKENATRRIQSAGRHRKAIADVEGRRSRSSSAHSPAPTEESETPKEVAARRLQSAERQRQAQNEVKERRSRSNSPDQPESRVVSEAETQQEKDVATRRIQSAGRRRSAQADAEERRTRSRSSSAQNRPQSTDNHQSAGVTAESNDDKDGATRRIQSAGRRRSAQADVEQRRSRSSSQQRREVEVATASSEASSSEKEGATKRIQSAGRHRKAIADVEDKKSSSRSSSPADQRSAVSS